MKVLLVATDAFILSQTEISAKLQFLRLALSIP